jgi:predicted CXXCH cytochrome family protein
VACVACHEEETQAWTGSHHDLAMAAATDSTVLGDFANATFRYGSVVSTFFRRDGQFFVRTDGPNGTLQEFEIVYTFGVVPLQQYLVPLPGGRLQALGIAWDSRPRDDGGQRWFHLYPDDNVTHEDDIHWTKPLQNWNYMCAECHSTNLRKNYDLDSDTYSTSYVDIDVNCEACHGPGSAHVAWGEYVGKDYVADEGEDTAVGPQPVGNLLSDFRPTDSTTTAVRTGSRDVRPLIETCARCHSRRSVFSEEFLPARSILNTHRPSLLSERLYFPDGQILDEVYVYASFLQSKMYAAGVACTDCHEPHSLQLIADGNALCSRCHLPAAYDSREHHGHRPDSTGGSCIACHMPQRNYMVIDPRADHSIRNPRPDLTLSIGVPNACQDCHPDQSAQWAVDSLRAWGGIAEDSTHYGEVIARARSRDPSALPDLAELARGAPAPFVRATAISLLGSSVPDRTVAQAILNASRDSEPLVRRAALTASDVLGPRASADLALPLLDDSVRAVRMEAARLLAGVPGDWISPPQARRIAEVVEEYVQAEKLNDDRPEAHLNIGLVYAARNQFSKAAAEYLTAIGLDSAFIPAYANLADVYRAQGREADAERTLEQGLRIADSAQLRHALGLLQVRTGRTDEALVNLESAHRMSPDDARFAYVLAIGRNSVGDPEGALQILEQSLNANPASPELLFALVTINRDVGRADAARRYARTLAEMNPENPQYAQLLQSLRSP